MLDKKTAAARDFAALHGYTLVQLRTTGQLAFRCYECEELLPLLITLPIVDAQATKQVFFSDHVAHAQTCTHIPLV